MLLVVVRCCCPPLSVRLRYRRRPHTTRSHTHAALPSSGSCLLPPLGLDCCCYFCFSASPLFHAVSLFLSARAPALSYLLPLHTYRDIYTHTARARPRKNRHAKEPSAADLLLFLTAALSLTSRSGFRASPCKRQTLSSSLLLLLQYSTDSHTTGGISRARISRATALSTLDARIRTDK